MATNQILSFFKTHKKIVVFFLLFLGCFLLSGDIAFAAEGDPIVDEETSDKIIQVINFILTGAASLLGIVTSFVTIFIYPGWTNGTMFGLLEYLKEIWILVSNVVYFIFAFILIAIAFMNIIGKGEGTWELKQALPKFIVGVLIVPFSWFFVQFILSISAILTVGVLTLPYDAFQDKDLFNQALSSPEIADMEVCKDVIIVLTGEPPEGASTYTDAEGNTISEKLFCKDDSKVKVKDILDPTSATGLESSIFGITSVYTYGILKVQELDEIHGDNIDDFKDLSDLIFKVFFDVLFVVVYLLLMVALFLALFVRGVRLWIYIMLSPLFGLLYFFGGGEKIVSKDKFSIGEFLALSMVPVYASAALAFGLAFILVASEGIREQAGEGDDMDTLRAGGFSLSIYGAHGGTGTTEKSPLAKMIVEIFGVVILWIAVMAALKSSKTTEAIVQPIAKFGEDVGNLAAKAPTYAPILPASIGGSAAGLSAMSSSLTSAIDSHYRGQGNDRGADFARNILGDTTPASDLRNATARHEGGVERGDPTAIRSTMEELMSRTTTENIRNQDFRRQFLRDLRNIFGGEIDENRARALETASTPEAFAQALAQVLRQDGASLDGDRRAALQRSLGGASLGSIDAAAVERLFRIGDRAPDPTPGPADNVTQTRNVNITVNGVETTAGAALDSLGTIDDRTALDTRLANDGITGPAAAAIVAAFEAARAAEDDE